MVSGGRRPAAAAAVALVVVVAVVVAWQLAAAPRVALGGLSVVVPQGCDRDRHEAGDAGSASVILYRSGAFGSPCVVLQQRSSPAADLLAQLTGAAPGASAERGVATPCGTALRVTGGGTTTYLLDRPGGGSWSVSFSVPDDTMPTCRSS